MFGTKEEEQETIEEGNLKYYKRLRKRAEEIIKDCKEEVKEEMVMCYLEQFNLWNRQFTHNTRLYNKLEDEKYIEEAKEAERITKWREKKR